MGIGGFWKTLLSCAANPDDNKTREWDSHGLRADTVVRLEKLSGRKRYKVSAIEFFDKVQSIVADSEDELFELVSLKADSVYTKAQLNKELETLDTCGFFDDVDLEVKTNNDGTIGLTVLFTEFQFEKVENFRCINVGLMEPLDGFDLENHMTLKEMVDYYRLRMEKARPCLLPSFVHGEILDMLGQRNVTARMLFNIRDKVQKWYHDEGYVGAKVVYFGNMHTKELVCEVMEGDITEAVIQIQDKQMNSHIGVVKRELPEQLQSGNVFNIEIGRQALDNIISLSLFSEIEINPRPDEKNEGGIIVEIKLKELDEVSAKWSIVPGRGECRER